MKKTPSGIAATILILLTIFVTLCACSGEERSGRTVGKESTASEASDITDRADISVNNTSDAMINRDKTETERSEENNVTAGIPSPGITDSEAEFSEGIRIKKYPGNNACFKLETPEGLQIVCDPYNIDETLQPDIVTESHQDSDHTDTSSLVLPYDLITEPGNYPYDAVNITGYPGNHNKGERSGINNIFVFTFEDITIAHFASQGAVPSDEILEQIGTVDILLIQFFINPNYNKLTVADVQSIVEKLKPRIIIPEHCDASSAGWLATRMKLKEENEASGSLVITREMLDAADTLRIISLEHE